MTPAALVPCPACRGLGEVETDRTPPRTCDICGGETEVDAEALLLRIAGWDAGEYHEWYVAELLAGCAPSLNEPQRWEAFEDLRTIVRQVGRLEEGSIDWQSVDDTLPWCPGVDRTETALGMLIDRRGKALARLLGRDAASVWRAGALQACAPVGACAVSDVVDSPDPQCLAGDDPQCCGDMIHLSNTDLWECAGAYFALVDDEILGDCGLRVAEADLTDDQRATLAHYRVSQREVVPVSAVLRGSTSLAERAR